MHYASELKPANMFCLLKFISVKLAIEDFFQSIISISNY